MSKDVKLITVPTFIFNQGDMLIDDCFERPIHVDFYDNCISLRQDGEYKQQEEIVISPKHIKALFREIIKHQKEATHFLKMRNS